jgi:hypothetical protein
LKKAKKVKPKKCSICGTRPTHEDVEDGRVDKNGNFACCAFYVSRGISEIFETMKSMRHRV